MTVPGQQPDLAIGPPAARRRDGAVRIEADVLGQPLWFGSAERRLEPASEAFASALLIAALGSPRRLRLEAPVSPVWLGNIERLLAVVAEWWGYPRLSPAAQPAAFSVAAAPGTGLFFSGGVDSLHTLLTWRARLDTLIFVLGYDIPLEDHATAADAERSAREVAARAGVELVVVRSNLRTHPAHGAANWERGHGGALAAVAHALGGWLGRVLVSATYPRTADERWGTDWRLDPLWSSERVALVHVGDELWRAQKLREIARDPICQDHLRVCWEDPTAGRLNCSRCEKCVRTMITLSQQGLLDRYALFDPPAPLHRLIADLPPLARPLLGAYRLILAASSDRRERRALRRLLARSERAARR